MNCMRLSRAGLIALWLGAGCTPASDTRLDENQSMSHTIEYWTNAPDDAYATSLIVSPEDGAALIVSSNRDDPGVPVIGRFGLKSDSAVFAPLLEAVLSQGF